MANPDAPAKQAEFTEQPEKLSPARVKPSKKWRTWRRVLVGIVAFLLINIGVVLLEPFFLYIISFQLTHTTEKILLYQDQPKPDILFMGSSRAENGLDPAVVEDAIAIKTGIRPRSLNLGMADGAFALNYLILKNIIRQNKQPSVIVYGLSELELDTTTTDRNYFDNIVNGTPNTGLLFRPDDLGKYGGTTLDEQATFLFNQAVPLFRDQSLILQALDVMFNPQNSYHSNYLNKIETPKNGFWANEIALTQEQKDRNSQVYRSRLPKFEIKKDDVAFFQDFLDLAKSRGIKVLLVNMPVNAAHLGLWQSAAKVKEYTDFVQKMAQQNGVPLVDLYRNSDNLFKPDDFFDSNHLNRQGATRLSQLIGSNYLSDLFKLNSGNARNFFQAQFSDLAVPPRLPTRFFTTGTVSIKNLSQNFWPVFGNKRVRLSYHWLNADGTPNIYEGERTELPYSIGPGETENITFTLRTPPDPGQYILEMDLAYEFVSWFSKQQNPTLRQTVLVQ